VGVIRKTASINTMGLVKYRGDREAIVHEARKQAERAERRAKKAEHDEAIARARRKTAEMHEGNVARHAAKTAVKASKVVPDPVLPFLPAGWYPDQADPALVRWFDGHSWTNQTSVPPGHWDRSQPGH